jgi:hypothetical protein
MQITGFCVIKAAKVMLFSKKTKFNTLICKNDPENSAVM